uniref:Alpha-2-HS-glycoprotein 2 n=1 Tax=Oryzias latipes TaxID=8090 RepID=A0A3P9KSB6_ORYLA
MCWINTPQTAGHLPLPRFILCSETSSKAHTDMNPLGFALVLGLLGGMQAQSNVLRPLCDSPEVEEAALVAQDFLNNQHNHGYKYALNRIEDVKILTAPDGSSTYCLEIELLETQCHVMDPTPVANCTVRPKRLTAIEGDCDVVLKKVNDTFTVTAFKCKTEESSEDLCLGCPELLPLNHTAALDFVHASLSKLNNETENVTYTLVDVGRMSSQVVSGGRQYIVEYVFVEANCLNDTCTPLNDTMAARGICTATGFHTDPAVNCKMFSYLIPLVDSNSTVAAEPALPPLVHVHSGGHNHGRSHHKLTALHDPHMSGLLSAESESAETVPVAPAVKVDAAVADPSLAPPTSSSSASDDSASVEVPLSVVKRAAQAPAAPAAQTDPVAVVPPCPGRIRFF